MQPSLARERRRRRSLTPTLTSHVILFRNVPHISLNSRFDFHSDLISSISITSASIASITRTPSHLRPFTRRYRQYDLNFLHQNIVTVKECMRNAA
jgi:hypothetical protein